LPNRHLIAQNIANKTAKIENPHPAVSLFNFHYATPPDAVAENAALNKVIGDDETGFNGNDDLAYRTEAWDFILAGGGLFNHLDYSFVAGQEDGTFAYPKTQPGGGSAAFRKQMKVLREFITGFDFVRMKPDHSVVQGGIPEGGTARALVEPGARVARDREGHVLDRGPGRRDERGERARHHAVRSVRRDRRIKPLIAGRSSGSS
jgi:hypothetical protein